MRAAVARALWTMIETRVLRRRTADSSEASGSWRAVWRCAAMTAATAAVLGLAACSSAPKEDPNCQANLEQLYAVA